jgi:hypothetical protein
VYLTRIQLITALGAVGLAAAVLELVRRRRLTEEYSLPWVISTVVVAVLGLSPPVLGAVTRALGILYESSLVFFVGLAFGTVMLLYLSIKLSQLTHEHQAVVRELALLRLRLDERAPESGAGPSPGGRA